jgi:hypothetical protein
MAPGVSAVGAGSPGRAVPAPPDTGQDGHRGPAYAPHRTAYSDQDGHRGPAYAPRGERTRRLH